MYSACAWVFADNHWMLTYTPRHRQDFAKFGLLICPEPCFLETAPPAVQISTVWLSAEST